MADYGTNVGATYIGKSLKKFYGKTCFFDVTHREFTSPASKELNNKIKHENQQFKILDVNYSGLQSYSGSDLTPGTPTEIQSTLAISQSKAFMDLIKDSSVFASQVKDPNSTIVDQASQALKDLVETYVLALYGDAASGNWIGTSYTTGTVEITVTTGAVAGTSTVFTAGMVGKPFKALGHTSWYRVKSRSSNTAIVIEDDSDDLTSAYTGGAIGAGATYEIQGDTKEAVTATTVFDFFVRAGILLDEQSVPEDGRYVVLPNDAKRSILSDKKALSLLEITQSERVNGHVYRDRVSGFQLYFSRNVAGDNSSGYNVIFGHKGFIAGGFGMISPIETVRAQNNFGEIVKGLCGYGAKVADGRRKFGVHALASFSLS
jgi:hypothetical protein